MPILPPRPSRLARPAAVKTYGLLLLVGIAGLQISSRSEADTAIPAASAPPAAAATPIAPAVKAPAPAAAPVTVASVAPAVQSAVTASPSQASNVLSADRFNIVAMVRNADIVVQAVMAFLALCSIATWTILVEKSLTLGKVRRRSRDFLAKFRGAGTVGALAERTGQGDISPVGQMWHAAKEEWDVFQTGHAGSAVTVHQADQLKQRMAVAANIVQEREMTRLSGAMGVLATIGSTAPFIGLFGTVWGILKSFIGIAATRATSLSVVAPGIAEALLATAIGLFAAIPAVMIYNKFARDLSFITGTLDNFQGELSSIVSRELDVVG
jgi:TolQ protein